MARAHQITTPQKSRIRQDLEAGASLKSVARKWQWARSSVAYIRDSSNNRTKKRRGRPRLISATTMKAIERYINLNWHTATEPWEKFMHTFGLTCSESTFRRAMHRHGLGRYIAARTPLRTRTQRNRRHLWGAKHQNDSDEDWQRVLWTDECTFELDLRVKQRVTRRRGERFEPDKTQWQKRRKTPGRINIWGGIAHNYKSPLIFIDGSGKNGAFLQKDYVAQVLEAHMDDIMADMRAAGIEPILMEDGNSAHGMRTTTNPAATWKHLHQIILLDWAANSPDLNPIEQIWRIIKQNLRQRRHAIHSMADYEAAIQEEWDAIPMATINELVATMRRRAITVYKNWGDSTGY